MVLLCNPFMFLWQTPPSCCWSKNSSAVGLGLPIEVSCPVSWVFLQWNKINAIEWLWHQFYKGCCLIQSISEGLLVLKSHGGSVVYQDVLPAFGDAEHTDIRSDFLFDSQLQGTWDSKGLESLPLMYISWRCFTWQSYPESREVNRDFSCIFLKCVVTPLSQRPSLHIIFYNTEAF